MKKNIFRTYLAVLAAVFSFAALTHAQTSPGGFPNVKIINFGQMDERLYRGGQPLESDYQALKDLGVTTVVDLRNDPTDYEKPAVEALGMKYINIPMSGWKYAKDAQVEEFMRIMNDPSSGTVFVHCKAGKHRTGLVNAIYRMEKYGWDYDQVYREMKNYDYSSWPVHFNIKAYVRDYAKELAARKSVAATPVAAGAQTVN